MEQYISMCNAKSEMRTINLEFFLIRTNCPKALLLDKIQIFCGEQILNLKPLLYFFLPLKI